MHRARLAASFLGLALACGDAGQDACPPGADACMCAAADQCLPGLQCIGGFCQADPDPDPATQAPTGGNDGDDEGDTTAATTTATSGDPPPGDGPSIPAYRWHTIGEAGAANDVAFTAAGQVAVVGRVRQGNDDAWLGVHTVDGDLVWEAVVDGAASSNDEFHGVAAHADGKLTAAGQQRVQARPDHLTITYDAQGTPLDLHPHIDDPGYDDEILGVDVDADGNLYICGVESIEDSQANSFVGRYDAAAGEPWMNHAFGFLPGYYVCKTGPSGYVVAAGAADFRRYDPDGTLVYMDDLGVADAVAHALAIDPIDEFVYYGGRFGDTQHSEPWIAGRDLYGDLQWQFKPVNEGDEMTLHDMTLDDHGWLRAVAELKIIDARLLVILTYDKEGVERDRTVWAPADDGPVRPFAIAARADTLYIVGGTLGLFDSQIFMASFAI